MISRPRIHILVLALVAVLTLPSLVAAAESQGLPVPQGAAIPDTPGEVKAGSTPVAVSHGDVDQLGTRLAFRLKEIFNGSGLFTLTSKDEPKIKVIVATRPEFSGRPQVGSVYGAVWIFSSGENVLTHYLASEAGTVDTTTVDATAEALAATTAAVAEKYAYLFE
ncbi:hypothetical protein [Desulfocurvus sp. DL9XJH121]